MYTTCLLARPQDLQCETDTPHHSNDITATANCGLMPAHMTPPKKAPRSSASIAPRRNRRSALFSLAATCQPTSTTFRTDMEPLAPLTEGKSSFLPLPQLHALLAWAPGASMLPDLLLGDDIIGPAGGVLREVRCDTSTTQRQAPIRAAGKRACRTFLPAHQCR